MAFDQKYGEITVSRDSENHPLNGSDEPVIVFRASDESALDVINFYGTLHADRTVFAAEILKTYEAFQTWRELHPDKVKLPD